MRWQEYEVSNVTNSPVFHAFTDRNNIVVGRGKITVAWGSWNVFHDVTSSFCALKHAPDLIDK